MEEEKITINSLKGKFDFDKEHMDNGEYIFTCDSNNTIDNMKGKFEFSVLPHQWWGNIKDPKIVVLALNPGYSQGNDELDSIVYKGLITNNYNLNLDHAQYMFDKTSKGIGGLSFEYSSISRWWRKVFSEFIPDKICFKPGAYFKNEQDYKEKINRFNEKVGFFNLVGYQSKDSSYIEKAYDCESAKLIAQYVNELAKTGNRLFIFVWGKDSWDEVITKNCKENNIKNYIVINKNDNIVREKKINCRNRYLKNKILPADYDNMRKILFEECIDTDFAFLNDYMNDTLK